MTAKTDQTTDEVRLYDDEGERLLSSDMFPERVSLLPGQFVRPGIGAADSIRILWGQDLLRDLIAGRYRTVICGVNEEDNSRGIISQLCTLVPTSQWTPRSVTSYARMFQASVGDHAANDKEPYVLKFDLDNILILGLLRPRGKDHFSLDDLKRGFQTINKMLSGRRDRLPAAAVSFLSAKANRLIGPDGREPSFERVVKTMHEGGFRGDVFPAPSMWRFGHVGVFPSYPFPENLDRMRAGSS